MPCSYLTLIFISYASFMSCRICTICFEELLGFDVSKVFISSSCLISAVWVAFFFISYLRIRHMCSLISVLFWICAVVVAVHGQKYRLLRHCEVFT